MISLNWVKDYIDIDGEDVNELAVKITKAGVNIEKVINSRIDNLVIGKVIECKKHSDSDHLNVCKVDIGNEVSQIVCGASNVRAGIKVLVALPGCILPGDVLIKAGKIRGEESNGMMCALYEIGIDKKFLSEADKNGICGAIFSCMCYLSFLFCRRTEFSFEIVSGNERNTERVVATSKPQTITYKVTISKGSETQEVVLSSVMNDTFMRACCK